MKKTQRLLRRPAVALALILFFGIAAIGSSSTAAAAAAPHSDYPPCKYATSDSDGDGWGWEDNASCRIRFCHSFAADPDGDGWGWEDNASCRIRFCQSSGSDPDGDGWGWEDARSCKVDQTQPTNDEGDANEQTEGCDSTGTCQPGVANGSLQTHGRYLLDASGQEVVLRGINHPHAWYPGRSGAFADIAATGANAIRVVLSNGEFTDGTYQKTDQADLANVIGQCRTHELICVLEIHDTTGFGDKIEAVSIDRAVQYWAEMADTIDGSEAFVIVNIANEPYGNNSADPGWIAATTTAIADVRSAGIDHVLMVDAPNWGQDHTHLMRNNAQIVVDSDPQSDTLLSVHMYSTYLTRDIIDDYLSYYDNEDLPIVIGEFGHEHYVNENGVNTHYSVDQDAVLDLSQQYSIGWFAWSWSGNGYPDDGLDLTYDFDPDRLTWWGDRVINGHNGIRETSIKVSSIS